MRLNAFTLVVAAGAVAVAASVALRDRPGGIGRFWGLFGAADQGPVDFATLVRRRTPNDALVCPSWLCQATPDIAAPLYALPAEDLRKRVITIVLADSDAVQVAEGGVSRSDRFVVRTPLLRFPDTVDLMVVPLGPDRSTLALYSRSLVGMGDMGTNLARLRRWLGDPALREAARGVASVPTD
ncbi:MAG: DUF1499 domain-containing protein [Alsobacter sp.]